MKILWIPGHARIKENEDAHDLSRTLRPSLLAQMVDFPLQSKDHGYKASCNQQDTSQDPRDYDPEEERLRIQKDCKLKLWEMIPPQQPPPFPGHRSA
ncbi:hypothetical protein IscW_ISCW006628 [Ixodes scapularis]|uniref:Uncharacterized protein n=1 Tax=Ixodes scapularis TaxID=6945 RepID=B7PPJ6_IXOSC|nr:hypothetical protein IscW_ISCW006628 [Ixodes scapularis]|eukprot:XP_002435688.1 hypothetical protein IscW_ISCW006628 [Ixodes scapularis]